MLIFLFDGSYNDEAEAQVPGTTLGSSIGKSFLN